MSTAVTPDTRFLTVGEVADRLRVSRKTIYRRIYDGSLEAVQVGDGFGPIRIDERELESWLFAEPARASASGPVERGVPVQGQSTAPPLAGEAA